MNIFSNKIIKDIYVFVLSDYWEDYFMSNNFNDFIKFVPIMENRIKEKLTI